jgi:hypothetical protein
MGLLFKLVKIFVAGSALMAFTFWVCDPGSADSQHRAKAKAAVAQQSAHPESFYTFDTVYRGK